MKLFYHFLFFVFASLILLACANLFNSDGRTVAPRHQPQRPDGGANNQKADDSIADIEQTNPYMLVGFKYSDFFNNITDNEKDGAGKKSQSKLVGLQMLL